MRDQDPVATPAELFATIFQQNWENVRGIKSERIWFMNTYSVISAGSLSLLQGIHGERVIQLTLIVALCLLSVIGFISSLRLKAELEECLDKIQAMVARAHVDEFVALGQPEGASMHYPAFRWVFPIFYFSGTVLFVGLLVYQLAFGGRP
jgi:hypothetical protein